MSSKLYDNKKTAGLGNAKLLQEANVICYFLPCLQLCAIHSLQSILQRWALVPLSFSFCSALLISLTSASMWMFCSFFIDRQRNDALWMSPLGLGAAIYQSPHTARECQSAAPLHGLSSHLSLPVPSVCVCLPLRMAVYNCMIVSLLCHFLGRFGKAHGAS